jgi:hypothetical protein
MHEEVLELAVASAVPASRTPRRPVVDARTRISCLPNPSTVRGGATKHKGPDPTIGLARDDELVVLMRQRVVGGELRSTVRPGLCAGGGASLDPPSMNVAHGRVDQIPRVEAHALIGVVTAVLTNLGHITAWMVKRLTGPIAV